MQYAGCTVALRDPVVGALVKQNRMYIDQEAGPHRMLRPCSANPILSEIRFFPLSLSTGGGYVFYRKECAGHGQFPRHWPRYHIKTGRKWERTSGSIITKNRDAAKTTLERIRELGSDGFLVQADVCYPHEVSWIFEQVRSEFGSLDIFVSNAPTEAATFYEAPIEIALEKWGTAVDSQAKALSRRVDDDEGPLPPLRLLERQRRTPCRLP
jgi:hypothetical protein